MTGGCPTGEGRIGNWAKRSGRQKCHNRTRSSSFIPEMRFSEGFRIELAYSINRGIPESKPNERSVSTRKQYKDSEYTEWQNLSKSDLKNWILWFANIQSGINEPESGTKTDNVTAA